MAPHAQPSQCTFKFSNLDWPAQVCGRCLKIYFKKKWLFRLLLIYSSPSTTATPASNFFHPTVITAGELHCCYCILTSRSYTSIHHGLSRFRHQAGLRDLLRGCTSVCVCAHYLLSISPNSVQNYVATVDPSGSEVSWNCVAASYWL